MKLDTGLRWLLGLLVGIVGCNLLLMATSSEFVMVWYGRVFGVPLIAVFVASTMGLIMQLLLRNLGGLLIVFGTGLITGGTLLSLLIANAHDSAFNVPLGQVGLVLIMPCAAMIGISRMDVDWADFGIDDILH